MKSFRLTLVFGIAVALLSIFAIYDFKRATRVEEQKEKGLALMQMKVDEVQRIELNRPMGRVVLEKKDEEWMLLAPLQDHADANEVRSLLSSLEAEKALETVVEGDGVDLATYGLEKPVLVLKLVSKEGRTLEIELGSVKAYDGNLYARIGDEKKILLVGQSWDSHLNKPTGEFRDKHLIRKPPESVARLEILQTEKGYPKEIRLQKEDGHWRLLNSAESYPLSDESIEAYIEQVKALRFVEVLDDDKNAVGLRKKRGLDVPALQIRLGLDPKDPGAELRVAGLKEGELHAAAESRDLDGIVSVYRVAAEGLKKQLEDFFDRKLPFRFVVSDVEWMQIDSPELKATFQKRGDQWEPVDKALQASVDGAKLRELVDGIAGLQVDRFLPPTRMGEVPAGLQDPSKIMLKKANGELVFEIRWGESDKERKYHPARTNKVDRMIGIAEAAITDLKLASLVKNPANNPAKK